MPEAPGARESAVAHWQEKEMNVNHFAEAFGKTDGLNAGTDYEIGDGLRGLYEILTNWNKFKAVMDKEMPGVIFS